MAKRRLKKITQERGTRAQPRELKTIRLRVNRPLEEKAIRVLHIPGIRKKKRLLKKTIGYNVLGPPEKRKEILKPSCQEKKAKARHNYFSMAKSGKGASRTNPLTDRFNSRC